MSSSESLSQENNAEVISELCDVLSPKEESTEAEVKEPKDKKPKTEQTSSEIELESAICDFQHRCEEIFNTAFEKFVFAITSAEELKEKLRGNLVEKEKELEKRKEANRTFAAAVNQLLAELQK